MTLSWGNGVSGLRWGITDSKAQIMKLITTKNQMLTHRKIICVIVLFWLATTTSAGICMAAENGHADKNAGFGADTLDALGYMRDELKLARDLYTALSGIWELEVFKNTVKGKQSLMDAVSSLLKQYGIDDPPDEAGKFVNADLQELYSYLIDQGKVSRNNAIDAAILIEQTVIADLNEVFHQTTEKEIHEVLTLLMEGSENHLQALSRNLVMY
jgi:hypothetical protein